MKSEDRRSGIVEMLMQEGTVSLDALAGRFAVSRMTIHRDLDALEGDGLLRKLRGGATVEASGRFESDFRYRARLAAEEKRRIARAAAGFLDPGSSVMIDDGSTSLALAPFLLERRPLTVITNNLALLGALTGHGGLDLIALGGTYSRRFNGLFGPLTEAALRGLRADVALISSSAISHSTAFHQDGEVLEVKRGMIAGSARRYLMADHAKFARTALYRLAELDAFDAVVTTDALDPARAAGLREGGVTLHLVAED